MVGSQEKNYIVPQESFLGKEQNENSHHCTTLLF